MQKKKQGEGNLKGTLVSVFALGFLIMLMWFGAYAFYLTR
ncbi:cytochrome C oxidase subunit II [Aquibacillus albus]|uniref:Cytochrome c oxidase subunit 2A n=1 Tax=Aquibacillus albus TaxID=1168171 RepID=A0ABS2N529_9BACI|nr:cytochrome C oxidase subunit II [Aquibacillus albus]MBM7573250.1 hypothetical protein [Aquibacillus albus]